MLLVWNMETGSLDATPILFNFYGELANYKIIHLYFSDGTNVKVIYEHAFWNHTLNRYVYFNDSEGMEFLGHWFNKQTIDEGGNLIWTKVQLIDIKVYYEQTSAWSPVTSYHLCFYVNGLLSMPADVQGLINIFEVNDLTMQYNQEAFEADIKKYGLFTYQEFITHLYVTEEVFYAFNLQYIKVSIGKGLIDFARLEYLAKEFSKYLETIN